MIRRVRNQILGKVIRVSYIYKNYFIHPVHRIAILINHHKKQLMTYIS